MEDLVKFAIALVFLALAVVLGSAVLMPMVSETMEDILTDKAELERAKGERYAMELEAQGDLALQQAAVRAVHADTNMVSVAFSILVVLVVVNTVGMVFMIATFWRRG